MCEASPQCTAFSHSTHWKDCFTCSACKLEALTTSRWYNSWRCAGASNSAEGQQQIKRPRVIDPRSQLGPKEQQQCNFSIPKDTAAPMVLETTKEQRCNVLPALASGSLTQRCEDMEPHTLAYLNALECTSLRSRASWRGPALEETLVVDLSGPAVVRLRHNRERSHQFAPNDKSRYFSLVDFSQQPAWGAGEDEFLRDSNVVLFGRTGSTIETYRTILYALHGGGEEPMNLSLHPYCPIYQRAPVLLP